MTASVWILLSPYFSSMNYTTDFCECNAAENHMLAIRAEFLVLGHGEATHQCRKVCPPGLLDHSSGSQLIHYEISHCSLLNWSFQLWGWMSCHWPKEMPQFFQTPLNYISFWISVFVFHSGGSRKRTCLKLHKDQQLTKKDSIFKKYMYKGLRNIKHRKAI